MAGYVSPMGGKQLQVRRGRRAVAMCSVVVVLATLSACEVGAVGRRCRPGPEQPVLFLPPGAEAHPFGIGGFHFRRGADIDRT